VLTSTFNIPNAKYYVVVDDGALEQLSNEPLMGIQKNIWEFSTGKKKTSCKYR